MLVQHQVTRVLGGSYCQILGIPYEPNYERDEIFDFGGRDA
jgi:hypothetical protein